MAITYKFPQQNHIYKYLTSSLKPQKKQIYNPDKEEKRLKLWLAISKNIAIFLENLETGNKAEVKSNIGVAFLEYERFFSKEYNEKLKDKITELLLRRYSERDSYLF